MQMLNLYNLNILFQQNMYKQQNQLYKWIQIKELYQQLRLHLLNKS